MAFISTVPVQTADGEVREMYQLNQADSSYVPNHTKIFSHRPQVNAAWGALLGSIRANLELRRYELVTLAAARALRSSYCSLAHGKILRDRFFGPERLEVIAEDFTQAGLEPVDVAIMAFAEQIARDATAVTASDIQGLRDHGLSDAEIFDVAAAASVRCFFSKLLDALGVEPDVAYAELEDGLRQQLTVGRPIAASEPERMV